MNKDRIFCIFLMLTAVLAVLLAGCSTPVSESGSSIAITPNPSLPPSSLSQNPAPLETSAGIIDSPGNITFNSGGISLEYTSRFREISNSSLGKMRAIADPTGINILTILTATDSRDSIQVTRQSAESTVEGLFNEKLAIANEVDINGSATVVAMTFIQYHVEMANLTDGTKMVRVSAENSDHGAAVTYLLCSKGYVYNLNFIYESADRANSQKPYRDALLKSVRLD